MLAKVISRAQVGIDAPEVIVEAHLSNGLLVSSSSDCWNPLLGPQCSTEFAFRYSPAPYHREPGVRRPAQGKRAFRSAHRRSHWFPGLGPTEDCCLMQ
jgi:hypothetical protein